MDALTEYEEKMAKAHVLIEALNVWVGDMGGITPDAVTKTHVDHLDEVLRGLRGAASWAGIDHWKGVA